MSTPAAQAYAQARQPYPAPTTTRLGSQELDHTHRCDTGRCGAQAWVRTESFDSTFDLLWCAHHYTAVENHFSTLTHAITDERPFLKAAVRAQANYANGVA